MILGVRRTYIISYEYIKITVIHIFPVKTIIYILLTTVVIYLTQ